MNVALKFKSEVEAGLLAQAQATGVTVRLGKLERS
jgi:hypothetical protein